MIHAPSVISIDPGSAGTGYAVWDMLAFKKADKRTITPLDVGVLNPPKIENSLEKLCIYYNTQVAYIENAAYWGGSEKGQVSSRTGSLVTLAQFIGGLQALCRQYGIKVYLFTPQVWKGTMSKAAVIHRINTHCPHLTGSSHSWDALGIGLYAMGIINQPKGKG